jgi:hypothetical protein
LIMQRSTAGVSRKDALALTATGRPRHSGTAETLFGAIEAPQNILRHSAMQIERPAVAADGMW